MPTIKVPRKTTTNVQKGFNYNKNIKAKNNIILNELPFNKVKSNKELSKLIVTKPIGKTDWSTTTARALAKINEPVLPKIPTNTGTGSFMLAGIATAFILTFALRDRK